MVGFVKPTNSSTMIKTPYHHQVLVASFHMLWNGKTLIWFQELEELENLTSWEAYVKALQIRIRPIPMMLQWKL